MAIRVLFPMLGNGSLLRFGLYIPPRGLPWSILAMSSVEGYVEFKERRK
jgi:hypothetical protein